MASVNILYWRVLFGLMSASIAATAQSALPEEVRHHESKLNDYFLRDQHRKAQRSFEWLWTHNPTHSQEYFETGVLLYDYLLEEGKEKERAHYRAMLDTLRELTQVDLTTIYEQRFNEYGYHPRPPDRTVDLPPNLTTNYDVAPYYPEGTEALLTCIKSHLRYPKVLRKHGTSAKVFVAFVIKADGSIGHVRMLRGITAEADMQITEAVQLCTPWVPAQKNSQPVSVSVVLPINFAFR